MAKIKIIDDDIEVGENLTLMLENEGYDVSVRDNTENAIEDLIQDKPDILILDVMFPENPAGGFDLARKIRQTDAVRNLPVILLTAINQEFPMDFSSQDIDQDWIPVQDFIEKPVEISNLLKKIRQLLSESNKKSS